MILSLVLNLIQGLMAAAVVMFWINGDPIWASFICLAINVALSVVVAFIENKLSIDSDNPKGLVREVLELLVQLITVLGWGIYFLATGTNVSNMPTPFLVFAVAAVIVLVNWGPLIAGLLRIIAWILEKLGGYEMSELIDELGIGGGTGGGGE